MSAVMKDASCKQNITIENGETYYFKLESEKRHQADFFCDNGYDMVGDDSVYCSEKDGKWRGNIPTCEGKASNTPHMTNYVYCQHTMTKMCSFTLDHRIILFTYNKSVYNWAKGVNSCILY